MRRFIPAAAAVICFVLAFFYQWKAQGVKGQMFGGQDQVILLLQEPMDYQQAAQRADAWQEEMGITLWGEAEGQIFAGAPGRSTKASLVVFEGSTELLFPGREILYSTDREGCLLDEKAAEELFGSHEIKGEVISNETDCWTVRGVLPFREGVVVLAAGAGTGDVRLDRLTARMGDRERQAVEELLWQGGFSGSLLRIDFYEDFSWVKELVPGKWADFTGWHSNIEKKQQEWQVLDNTEKYVPELIRVRECRRFQWYYGVSILFLLIFLIFLHIVVVVFVLDILPERGDNK